MRHVVPQDLADPERLLRLFEDACRARLVAESEADRLAFFGMAAHATCHGRRNPCGLFVSGVTRRLWRHISLTDEDSARRTLGRLQTLSAGKGAIRETSPRMPRGACSERPDVVRRLVADSLASVGEFGHGRPAMVLIDE